MNRPAIPALVLVAAFTTLACDAGDSPDAAHAGAMDASAELAPVNRSGITGTVRAEHSGDEATVTLTVQGLEPGVAYPAHIHEGRCAAGGPVVVSLGELTAESDGSATHSADVEGTQMSPDVPAFVQVHGPDGAAVACADLGGHEGDAALTDRAEPGEGAVTDTAGAADPAAATDTVIPADTAATSGAE